MGPHQLKRKSRVCSQSQAPALQASAPSCGKVQEFTEVSGSQLGTSQLLLHKPRTALQTLVGYSPVVSPSGRMRSSCIIVSAP